MDTKYLHCCAKFTRILLLILNTINLLIALTLIGLGIYMKVADTFSAILKELAMVSNFEGQSLGFLAFVLIGGGIFTLLLAFVGFIGALRHIRCLIYMYIVILVILIILELVGFILVFAYRSKLEATYKDSLLEVFKNAVKTHDDKVLTPFHELEKSVKCCGIDSFKDYTNSGQDAPSYCYEPEYKTGCSTVIIDWLKKRLPIIGGILGAVFLIQLLGFVSAFIFVRALKAVAEKADSSLIPDENTHLIVQGRRRNYYKKK